MDSFFFHFEWKAKLMVDTQTVGRCHFEFSLVTDTKEVLGPVFPQQINLPLI